MGESEANMKAALKVAEQASPCVLWIDELEKAFQALTGPGKHRNHNPSVWLFSDLDAGEAGRGVCCGNCQ